MVLPGVIATDVALGQSALSVQNGRSALIGLSGLTGQSALIERSGLIEQIALIAPMRKVGTVVVAVVARVDGAQTVPRARTVRSSTPIPMLPSLPPMSRFP
jgi:hypothetical protein